MLRLAADENLNYNIVRRVLRVNPKVDIVRVQEAGLSGADDPTVLAWAANESRVLLSHDVVTMTKYAYERIAAGESMPGLFEVSFRSSIGRIIEDILLLVECSFDNEWEGQVRYLPL